jgi:SAM-dependent methyltransferase
VLLVAVGLGGALAAGAQTPPSAPLPSVPYIPTPEPIVLEMLRLAQVSRDDVVYDLGSGDGRIVITAARRFGARAVGIEQEPHLVEQSIAKAKELAIDDRVRFVQGDLFEADLSSATVVTLYLLPEVNLKLRPKLLAELRPGSRIVSHNYDLGSWRPNRRVSIMHEGTEHTVYYWVVPEPERR